MLIRTMRIHMIKDCNPNMQIIAVGDMEQKIYDKTTLNVESFMKGFLEDPLRLKFTQCFRLAHDLAALLGRVWKKEIKGVNKCCKVEEMAREDIVLFLAEQNPADILCLGARQEAGITVTVITIEPQNISYGSPEFCQRLIQKMQERGIQVIVKEDVIEHFAIIDDELVWHGGMNLLGKEDAWDNLMRIKSDQVAAELLEIALM